MEVQTSTEVSVPPCKKSKLDDAEVMESGNEVVCCDVKKSSAASATVCDSKVSADSTLRETDVGITEYMSNHKGFHGVVKQRYSDFLVHEIGLDGCVTHLTDISPPACDQSAPTDDTECVLSEEQIGELRSLVESGDEKRQVTIEVGTDKSHRGRVHQFIRKLLPGLESTTQDGSTEGSKVIIVKLATEQSKHDKRNRGGGWSKQEGDYCHFVMYKENKQSMEAVNLLSKLLRVKPAMITYAGTKDKRAKTTQHMSVYRQSATRLHALNKILKGITLGNFKYAKTPLRLGDLKGNRFSIVLRNVSGTTQEIATAMESLQQTGFINYFGMQRFGTTTVPTHHVGRALLKSEWQEAIDLILKPRDGDIPELAKAREVWHTTRDAAAALKHLARYHGSEKQLLQGLSRRNSADLVNALAMIPRHMRSMYIHAYQSHLWNTLASRRLSQLGRSVVVGDLVLPDGEDTGNDDDGEHSKWPTPVVVTMETVSQYSIHQVVLPLPGHSVVLPDNDVAAWYNELLDRDSLSMSHFKHRVRDYSLPGGYRYLVTKPAHLTWSSHTYTDLTLPLIASDLDTLEGRTYEAENQALFRVSAQFSLHQRLTVLSLMCVPEGGQRALSLAFTLPPSCYATMALREVLRQDTSAAHQTTLNA